jgi:hypothetical protein
MNHYTTPSQNFPINQILREHHVNLWNIRVKSEAAESNFWFQ